MSAENDILREDTPDELEELDNIIVLTDEEGNDVEFEFVDIIEYEGENYVVLIPIEEETEGGSEVVILRVEEDPDDEEFENYVAVEDDAVLEKVFDLFKEQYKDEFDWAD